MHVRIFLTSRYIVKFYKNIIFSKRKNGKIAIQKYRPIGRYGIFLCFLILSPRTFSGELFLADCAGACFWNKMCVGGFSQGIIGRVELGLCHAEHFSAFGKDCIGKYRRKLLHFFAKDPKRVGLPIQFQIISIWKSASIILLFHCAESCFQPGFFHTCFFY